MNDITKARYYLKSKHSDLQHLGSFGTMLVTAENKYKEIRLKKKGNRDMVGTYDEREADALLDMAVLRHLRKHNQLPKNLPQALRPEITIEEKRELSMGWLNA